MIWMLENFGFIYCFVFRFDMEASCSGYTMMGGPRTPVGVNAGRLGRSRVLHHQDCEKKQKLSNINMR